jgi:cobyrinic acid a,c-diamide synthase
MATNQILTDTPGLIISGTTSDVGKSSIAMGLMRLFKRKGYRVQPFKVGPDYIDPTHHVRACERPAYNLDSWMSSKPYVRKLYREKIQSADLTIVEGVMGLFDGAHPKQDRGSTAEAAKLLDLPVLLVIDGQAMARSAAALVQGFIQFDPKVRFIGVIANRVNHPGHSNLIKAAIEHYTSAKYLGYLPSNPDLNIPSRHLGLYLSGEQNSHIYDQWADHIEKHVDIKGLIKQLHIRKPGSGKSFVPPKNKSAQKNKVTDFKVAIAKDDAFMFLYQDTIELIENSGGQIHYFSPLKDSKLPADVDWIYIPGGYPELHLKSLSKNKKLLNEIQQFGESGKPIVGECGGLMYLGKSITDADGKAHKTVGLFNFSTSIEHKKLTIGYRRFHHSSRSNTGGKLLFKGHEFHSSSFKENKEKPLWTHSTKKQGPAIQDGYRHKNCFALYSHIHWASSPAWLKFILQEMKPR